MEVNTDAFSAHMLWSLLFFHRNPAFLLLLLECCVPLPR